MLENKLVSSIIFNIREKNSIMNLLFTEILLYPQVLWTKLQESASVRQIIFSSFKISLTIIDFLRLQITRYSIGKCAQPAQCSKTHSYKREPLISNLIELKNLCHYSVENDGSHERQFDSILSKSFTLHRLMIQFHKTQMTSLPIKKIKETKKRHLIIVENEKKSDKNFLLVKSVDCCSCRAFQLPSYYC